MSAPELANSLAADAELWGEFAVEAREHLEAIEAQTLALERDRGDSDAIHSLFRAFHTIKGLAGFLDLQGIEVVAHEVETVLDLARNSQLAITPRVIAGILECKDFCECSIAALDGGGREPPDGEQIVALLRALAGGGRENPVWSEIPAPEPASFPALFHRDDTFVKVPTTKLDYLVDMIGEMVVAQSMLQHDPDLAPHRQSP